MTTTKFYGIKKAVSTWNNAIGYNYVVSIWYNVKTNKVTAEINTNTPYYNKIGDNELVACKTNLNFNRLTMTELQKTVEDYIKYDGYRPQW